MQVATFVAYLTAAALFIYGIRRLRTPETARSGNTLAAIGMVIALIATVFGVLLNPNRVVGRLEFLDVVEQLHVRPRAIGPGGH